MDNLPHLVGRVSLVLEIVGTILLASSLAGPERVQKWESRIHSYLNFRSVTNYITERITKFKDVLTFMVGMFAVPLLLIAFVTVIGPTIDTWLMEPLPPAIVKILSFPLRGLSDSEAQQSAKELVSLIAIILLTQSFIFVFFYSGVILSDPTLMVTRVIALIVSELIFFMLMILYGITLLLLFPYVLAERLAFRFNLRPVLGVLGTIVILIGLAMQFWE